MKPALVVLAAGASTRLGTCKALVEFAGRTILERHLANADLFDTKPIVVTGHHHDLIERVTPASAEVLFNPRWSEGRTGGIQLARAARPNRPLVIAPVDVPLIPRSVLELLLREWSQAGKPPRGWLAPSFTKPGGKTRFGHPVVIGAELLEEISGFEADTPLRTLRDLATPVFAAPTSSDEILLDLDTPEDLAAIRQRDPE